MTVKYRGKFKDLVQKTNGTSDLPESPAPTFAASSPLMEDGEDARLKGLTVRQNLIAHCSLGEKMRMNMEDGQDAGKKVKKISKPKVEKEPVELV